MNLSSKVSDAVKSLEYRLHKGEVESVEYSANQKLKYFDFDKPYMKVFFDGGEYADVFGGELLESKMTLYQDGLFFEPDVIMQFAAKTDIEKVKQVLVAVFESQMPSPGSFLTGYAKNCYDAYSKLKEFNSILDYLHSIDHLKVIDSSCQQIGVFEEGERVLNIPLKTKEGFLSPESIDLINVNSEQIDSLQVNWVLKEVKKEEALVDEMKKEFLQDAYECQISLGR